MQLDRARRIPNIHLMLDKEVKEWLPSNPQEQDRVLGGVRLKSTVNDEEQLLENISGGFIAIGHTPNTSFLRSSSGIALDAEGYITAANKCMTSLPGAIYSIIICYDSAI